MSRTIRRWLSHYETLLRGAVARPDDTVARLPLLYAPFLACLMNPVPSTCLVTAREYSLVCSITARSSG